ncbi:MAG: YceH family protein [Elusimicrobia bacterium]|nr:YceH family protein [Elusimicrobiota bacterium]
MLIELNPIEARLLGSLVEKSLTTPGLYPLTFNSLINACNQKTNRDPVMSLDADTAGKGIQTLIEKGLAERLQLPGDRVPKFKHHIEKLLNGADSKLIGTICVLLLRGPQTPGGIKTRTDRLCTFTGTAEVEGLLQKLCARSEDPLVARLPRQPGQKETRYQHLLGGPIAHAPAEPFPKIVPPSADRLSNLETRVGALEAFVKTLQLQPPRNQT